METKLMNAETLTALKQSIEKWERNAWAESPYDFTVSSNSCALCDMFSKSRCDGCPVRSRTGKSFCKETPYKDALAAKYEWLYPSYWSTKSLSELRDDARAAARAEVKFLWSLLPEEHRY